MVSTPHDWLISAIGSADTDCIIWPFSHNGKGYGQFWLGSIRHYAHRYVCEIWHGPAPDPTYHAAHLCGNGQGGCVNPKHLQWKTPGENAKDKFTHGTQLLGSECPTAKLTESQVLEILSAADIETGKQIAERFGISVAQVNRILRGERWEWFSGYKSKSIGRRSPVGENHPRSRLSDQDVLSIRQSNLSNKSLATQYRVNDSTISRVRRGLQHKVESPRSVKWRFR